MAKAMQQSGAMQQGWHRRSQGPSTMQYTGQQHSTLCSTQDVWVAVKRGSAGQTKLVSAAENCHCQHWSSLALLCPKHATRVGGGQLQRPGCSQLSGRRRSGARGSKGPAAVSGTEGSTFQGLALPSCWLRARHQCRVSTTCKEQPEGASKQLKKLAGVLQCADYVAPIGLTAAPPACHISAT